jgi:hypothetical protein
MKHSLDDLEMLARHWPVLFGRSMNHEEILGVQGLSQNMGRPDHIDDKSPEIQAALRAITRLQQMSADPEQKRLAEVLLYARVYCGATARSTLDFYLTLELRFMQQPPKNLTQARKKKLSHQGALLYNKACESYNQTEH